VLNDRRRVGHPYVQAAELRYCLPMGMIRAERRFAIRLFLRSLASWQPSEIEPEYVYRERREWANTVLELIVADYPDDLEVLALESLARAVLALCDNPQDADAVAWFEEAGESLLEISQLSG
jgi:hypothetical protein